MENPLERLIPEMRRGVMQIVILSMLCEKSYGYALGKRMAEHGFPIEEGTLYPILRRFEEQGIVSSSWDTEGPRPRKYYQSTHRGQELLDKLSKEWKEIGTSLEKILPKQKRMRKWKVKS